jgi:hypothetical protein
VSVPALPAVIAGKPVTLSVLALAATTWRVRVPVRVLWATSVTVMVWLPAFFRVTENLWVPLSALVNV